MVHHTVIDTFPDFERVWAQVRDQPVEVQVAAWQQAYLGAYPELAGKIIRGAEADGLDWHQVATDRALPLVSLLMPQMREAHGNLLHVLDRVCERAGDALSVELDVTFVLYVGVGWCGWATRYGGSPACLLGLEGTAEEGWTDPDTLAGLVAHEVGHLAHDRWRELARAAAGDGAAWDLYREGFAQFCEHRILGRPSWHMQARSSSWLPWCRERLAWLAARYLAALKAGAPVNDFFGNWLDIEGHSMAGYYLGHELVARWCAGDDPAAIAVLAPSDIGARVQTTLIAMAGNGG